MIPKNKQIKIKKSLLNYSKHLMFFTDTTGRLLCDYMPAVLKTKQIIATSGVITKLSFLGLTVVHFNLAIAYRDDLSGKELILNVKINRRYRNAQKK